MSSPGVWKLEPLKPNFPFLFPEVRESGLLLLRGGYVGPSVHRLQRNQPISVARKGERHPRRVGLNRIVRSSSSPRLLGIPTRNGKDSQSTDSSDVLPC